MAGCTISGRRFVFDGSAPISEAPTTYREYGGLTDFAMGVAITTTAIGTASSALVARLGGSLKRCPAPRPFLPVTHSPSYLSLTIAD